MASSKSRQRALARAKAERQTARRAMTARKRRRVKAATTAIATVVVVVLGSLWVGGVFDPPAKPRAQCAWVNASDPTNASLQDVGKPPTRNIPKSGTRTMSIALAQGTVDVELDLARVMCGAASFAHLADKKFFNNTKCHRLVTSGYHALQCGDPSGTGRGGPTYALADENLPKAVATGPSTSTNTASAATSPSDAVATSPPTTDAYKRGVVAFFNTNPGSNGSQFYIFYKDSPGISPQFSIIGTVTKGIEVIDGIAQVGIGGQENGEIIDGPPKNDVVIQSLTVGPVKPVIPTIPPASPTSPAGGSASPSMTSGPSSTPPKP